MDVVDENAVKDAIDKAAEPIESFNEQSAKLDIAEESSSKQAIEDAQAELDNAGKNVINRVMDVLADKTGTTNSFDKGVFDKFIESLNNKNDIEEANKSINDFDKNNSSNSYWKNFKDFLSSTYESLSNYFSSSPEEAKSQTVEDATKESEDIEKKVNELKNDTDIKEKAESLGIKWKLLLFLLAAGGTLFGLWYAAKSSSGCYMEIVGEDSILLSCSGYYNDDTQQFCSCGTPTDPLDCTKSENYPYCKCVDETQKKVCGDLKNNGDIFYRYKNYNIFTVIPELVKAASKNLGDAVGDFFSSLLKNLSGPLKIILYIFIGILILWIFLKMIISLYKSKKEDE